MNYFKEKNIIKLTNSNISGDNNNNEIEILKKKNKELENTLKSLQIYIKNIEKENSEFLNIIKDIKEKYENNDNNKYLDYINKWREERKELNNKIIKLEDNNDSIGYKSILEKINKNLGNNINDNFNNLITQTHNISKGAKYVPDILKTFDEIINIVNNKNIFEIKCENTQDLINIIDSWALNLHDYFSLVEEISSVLSLNQEDLQRNSIINTVKRLSLNQPNNNENELINNIMEKLFINNKDDILPTLDKLKNSFSIWNDFIEISKKIINIEDSFSDDIILSKVIKILEIYYSKEINN